MFVIVLNYTADLSEIDDALADHVTWLEGHYESGLFLASGRREPRVGGVILARGDRADVEAAVAGDPFATRGLAQHSVIEFHPSKLGEPFDTVEIRQALA